MGVNKRIPELVNAPSAADGDKIALYDSQGDITKHINKSDLIPASAESTNIDWNSLVTYNIGDIVKFDGLLWESDNNGNLGNVPQEDANWTEVSKSASGLVLYVAGVFTQDEVYVINTIPNRNGFWLLRLANATRPFNSTDFTTEYNNGDWAVVGEKNKYGVDTGVADAYVITLNEPITTLEDGMLVLFKADNPNTGASTINIDGLGVEDIVTSAGSPPSAGQIANLTLIAYDTAIGMFQLVGSGGGGGGGGWELTGTTTLTGDVSIEGGANDINFEALNIGLKTSTLLFGKPTVGGDSIIFVVSNDTNASMHLRGKGTGGVKLGTAGGAIKIEMDSTGVGFYAKTPVAKPLSTKSARQALEDLGLLTTGGAEVAPNPSALTDSGSIAFDLNNDFFNLLTLDTTTTTITLTLSNVIQGANQVLSVKKNTASDVTITLAGSGLTFYGYNGADLNGTPDLVLSGASGDIFDISFLARTATEIGVAIGVNGN